MMTIEKGKLDPHSPPLHVHVDQQTPVHVHVKKPGHGHKKSATARALEERLKKAKKLSSPSHHFSSYLRPSVSSRGPSSTSLRGHSSSTLRGPSSSSLRGQSSSTLRGPWVPAPARSSKTTKGKKFGWQSNSHSLSIEPPDDVHATLRVADLDYDDSSTEDTKFHRYENKIDSLMTQVGTLKSQRDLEKTKRVAEKTKDELEISKRVMENQEVEITEFREELEMTERENRQLRRSVDRLKEDTDYSMYEQDHEHVEHDKLLKKMVEAEFDADAAAKQVTVLRDVCHRLKEEKRISSHDAKVLTKQRDILLQKLEDFENTNATLRQMLREQHKLEANKGHPEEQRDEQRDVLLRKLTESDTTNHKLRQAVMEKTHELDSVKVMLNAEKEQGRSLADLQGSIEATRAHLQNQLRKREGDCNRMAVQIRKLENQVEQERIETNHLQSLLQSAKEKAMADKDALKRATRAQKDRAMRSEDTVEKMNAQLLEMETQLAENQLVTDQLKSKQEKTYRERVQVDGENAALSRRIEEIEVRIRESEMQHRLAMDDTNTKLHSKSSEANSSRLENDKLRATLATVQDKLTFAESEIDQLKSSLHEYENLVSDYKSQMNKSRREALDTSMKLEQQEHDKSRLQQESNVALINVEGVVKQRSQELEEIQKRLNSTQERLNYSEEKLQESFHVRCDLDKSAQELDDTKEKLRDTQMKLQELGHVQEKLELKKKELDISQHKLQETEQQLHYSANAHAEMQGRVHELERTCEKLNSIERKLEDAQSVKGQMEKYKKEFEETTVMLREAEHQLMAFENVRERLELRLKELEPLPTMLHNTEKQLLEATEKLLAQERRSAEQASFVTELTKKVDHQSDQVESFRDKWHTAQDECRAQQARLEAIERRLKETDDENRELHAGRAKREEIIHQNQLRLEEKTSENNSISRQLEQAIADNRRLEEEGREKAIQRERNAQARILDLESQVSRSKTEVLQIKRQKEDTERKFNSQLYDLKDRLEQSHSTNRSMQNYVTFLKSSYSNVFGDTSISGSPYKTRPSPQH